MVHWLSSPIFPCLSFVRSSSRYGNIRPNLHFFQAYTGIKAKNHLYHMVKMLKILLNNDNICICFILIFVFAFSDTQVFVCGHPSHQDDSIDHIYHLQSLLFGSWGGRSLTITCFSSISIKKIKEN